MTWMPRLFLSPQNAVSQQVRMLVERAGGTYDN